MTTKQKTAGVDLGALQAQVEESRRLFTATGKALERAQTDHDLAKARRVAADQALADGFRTVKG